MPAELKSKIELEIAHVLFIDVVGYSRMLIDEEHECMDTLNRIIRSADAFRVAEAADKLIRLIHELLCECGSEQGEQQWIHLFEEGLRKIPRWRFRVSARVDERYREDTRRFRWPVAILSKGDLPIGSSVVHALSR